MFVFYFAITSQKENPAIFPDSRGEILKILIKIKNLKSKSTYRCKYACSIL